MQEAVSAFRPGASYNQPGSLGGNPLALEFWEHAPTRLPNKLTVPGPFPIANRTGRLSFLAGEDHKHTAGITPLAVAVVVGADLVQGFGAAEMFSHTWFAHQPFKKRQVSY